MAHENALRGRRILWVEASVHRAGSGELQLISCRELRRRGAETCVLVLDEPGDVAIELEEKHLARVLTPCVGDSALQLEASLEIRRALREFQPDLLIAGRFNAALHATLAAPLGRGKMKTAIEVTSSDEWMRPWHELAWFGLLHRTDLVTASSERLAQRITRRYRIPPARVRAVHVGADLLGLERLDRREAKQRLGIPEDQPVVGSLGILHRTKRYDRLFRAVKKLEESTPFRPWIVLSGEGPAGPELSDLARTLDLQDRLVFAPWKPNAGLQLSSMDVFVMPSDHDGLPLAIAQAMAMDIPVVASAVSGIPEIVEDGVTGRLFERDDLDALIRGLREALEGGVEVARRTKVARAFALENFSADQYAARIGDAYQALIDGNLRN